MPALVEAYPPDSPVIALLRLRLGKLLLHVGRWREAAAALAAAEGPLRAAFPEDDPRRVALAEVMGEAQHRCSV